MPGRSRGMIRLTIEGLSQLSMPVPDAFEFGPCPASGCERIHDACGREKGGAVPRDVSHCIVGVPRHLLRMPAPNSEDFR